MDDGGAAQGADHWPMVGNRLRLLPVHTIPTVPTPNHKELLSLLQSWKMLSLTSHVPLHQTKDKRIIMVDWKSGGPNIWIWLFGPVWLRLRAFYTEAAWPTQRWPFLELPLPPKSKSNTHKLVASMNWSVSRYWAIEGIYRVIFSLVPPLKVPSTKKLI